MRKADKGRQGQRENPKVSQKPRSNWVYLNLVKIIFYSIRQKAKIDVIIKFRWH